MIAQRQQTPVKSAAASFSPATRPVLQRKCACGGTPGPSGECEECRRKRRRALQTKLVVNRPGDVFEQEADRIADQVTRMPIRREVSGAPLRVQRFSGQTDGRFDAAPPSVDRALASPGTPLQPSVRHDMEQRFGYDFSKVRVHSDAAAEQSAREVNAQAYTVGPDIVFGAGRFAPETQQGRRLLAHELTHAVQQSGGIATKPEPLPVRAFTSAPLLARACDAAPCPAIEFPIGAFSPSWQLAEECLQQQYKRSHPNNTVGGNKHWAGLIGKNPREEATIECFRQYYSARGYESDEARRKRRRSQGRGEGTDIPVERQGAAQPQAEPDIIDFTDLTIMEITTPSGVPYRARKIIWEVEEATKLMDSCDIRGRKQWSIGTFAPAACYQIVGAGPNLAGKMFFRTWQNGGILIYEPVLDVTREVVALATLLAAAAAAAAANSGGPSSTTEPLKNPPSHTLPITPLAAAVIAALAAFVIWLARFIKPLRIAAFIGTLLGMLLKGLGLGLAFADEKGDYAGDEGDSGSGKRVRGSGVAPVPTPGGSNDQTGGPPAGPPIVTKVPVPGQGPPAETTTPPGRSTIPPGGGTVSPQDATSPPVGTSAPGGGAPLESLLAKLLDLLMRLLGKDRPGAGGTTPSGTSRGDIRPPGGASKDKVPVAPIAPPKGSTKPPAPTTKPPAATTTPAPTSTKTPPKSKKQSAPKHPQPQTTARSQSDATAVSPGKAGQTTQGVPARRSSATLPEIEVGSIEGLDLRTVAPGWWSFVMFDGGSPREKLVLLGLIEIHRGDSENVFEFRSGEGECNRQGCSGGRNTYFIRWPRRTTAAESNGFVIFSDLKGFFPHEPNLQDLAVALDAAGKAGEAETIRRFAERQSK